MVTIKVNGLTLVHQNSGGVATADLPNVCMTPGDDGMTAVNYSNTAFSKDLANGTTTVFADGGHMCAHSDSMFAKSAGDEPGTGGGVTSGTHSAEATWLSFSLDVTIEGRGACRLTDQMLMNHGNTACLGGVVQDNFSRTPEKECDSDPLPALEGFDSDIGGYSKEELNDATKTLFGELSPDLHAKINEEAEAIASTIMNRKAAILDARAAFDAADTAVGAAQESYNQAVSAFEGLTKHPSKYRKALGADGYADKVRQAGQAYKEAKAGLGQAQNARTLAGTEKKYAEGFLGNRDVDLDIENPTLSDITKPHDQYEGTIKGKGDYEEYHNGGMNASDRKRNCKRWQAARHAVEKLAQDPDQRKEYLFFRSNLDGKRTLRPGETRIGGTDFDTRELKK